MTDRFSLRFQSTERRGEEVSISRAGLTVGRKPGNTLQILDNSVSGKHAELTIDADGVLLRDLGSTNGTRVGTERVLEKRLSDGEIVTFGNVEFAFRDGEASAPALEGFDDDDNEPVTVARGVSAAGASSSARASSTPARAAPDSGGGLERVDAGLVARAGQRSPAALIGLGVVVLAAVGAGVWFFVLRPSESTANEPALVQPVPGNLLAEGYSFESDLDPFEALESAPAAFLPNANARVSGAQGVRAELAANEWAAHRSQTFRVGAERVVEARAALRTRGEAQGRLGVEFSVAEDAEVQVAPITAWAGVVSGSSDFTESEIDAPVPPGMSRARVVVFARATGADSGGVVDADDVSAVENASPSEPAAQISGASLFLHGAPPISAQLARIDRVLISGMSFTGTAASGALAAQDAAPLSVRVDGAQIVLSAKDAPRPTRLVLRVEGALATGGIATTGKDGYRSAGATLERADADSLILGRGTDLVRVGLPGPCAVRGVSDGAAVVVTVELGSLEPQIEMQLDFSADKGAAEGLAHAARGAEQKGDLGAALAKWRELLDRFPYEVGLVEEAEATHAKLLQTGLAQVRETKAEAERARFFELPDMFAATRQRALGLADRFAGSEVEKEARDLAAALESEVAKLRTDEHRAERDRLTAMLGVLRARGAQGLADEVSARLSKLEGSK